MNVVREFLIMALCCGNSGTAYVQTRFLGASVVRFSAQAGWNGGAGGLQVELAEDLCNGDAFNPPGVGEPVYFSMGGFTNGGILQNWKQNDSATGTKSYTINIVSPRDILEGTNIILSSYNGPTMGVPNLANVYGWLEATYGNPCSESGFQGQGNFPTLSSDLTYQPAPGFGGAKNNEVGIPWIQIKEAMNAILNGSGGSYGGVMTFRGHLHYFDMSELPVLNDDIRIGGENISVDGIVSHVCGLAGMDYFYELLTPGAGCNESTVNIIKVRTSGGFVDESAEVVDAACDTNIDSRLSLGSIGQTIASSTCVNRYGRGLELKIDVTNAFITGEFRQEVWQTQFDDKIGDSGGTNFKCMGDATIWPYWGKEADGTIIIGEECGDGSFSQEQDKLDHGHHFVVDTQHLGIGVDEWDVTMFELRAALVSKGHWETWLWEREPAKYKKIFGLAEQDVWNKQKQLGDIGLQLAQAFGNPNAGDKDFIKAINLVQTTNKPVKDLAAADDLQVLKNGKLYDFVRKYAQEYFGRQFMVRLPFMCVRSNPDIGDNPARPDQPWTFETNWEATDSGWTEWPVLGLPNPGWILENFRTDDGKIKCFVKFTSSEPMVLDNLSKSDYFAVDMYNVFVTGTCNEIVWVTPNDARAVVTLSGPVSSYNKDRVLPEWLLAFAITGHLHGLTKEDFMEVIRGISTDKLSLGMPESFLMPIAAAVPLQSTRIVYGPWFAKQTDLPGFDFSGGGSLFGGSDKGKTIYNRESGFAPWHFGGWELMDNVAYQTASASLGEQYVLEMGDITLPGSPIGSLGSLLAGSGPSVSQIDVQAGRGNGAITTTYRMRTHTPDTGKMAKQRIDQIRHAATVAQKAERMFKKHALDRLRNQFETRLGQQLQEWKTSPGLSGNSSHDIMGGQAGLDVAGPDLTTVDLTEIQHYHIQQDRPRVVQTPVTYEEVDQDDEPHARSVTTQSEMRKDIRTARADLGHKWRRRAYMENIGMFRPFSTLPHNQKALKDDSYFMSHFRNEAHKELILKEDSCSTIEGTKKLHDVQGCPKNPNEFMTNNVDFFSHEQVPPIFCKEQHLPINITTLSPFLSKGRALVPGGNGWGAGGICLTKDPDISKGHDIEYIARDGVYPTNMSVRHPQDNYSKEHWYRAIALRGPLVLAGWGFDIDNKPVPNESDTYPINPKMKFEQDWLRKPQKWMTGPVDLRWDYKRHVWTAPSPMKIVKLELLENLCIESCCNAILYGDHQQYDYDGNGVTCEEGCADKVGYKIKVYSNAMYPVPKGWRVMAYFDTTHNRYQMLSHDPLPIVEVDLNEDMICVDGTGTIVGPAGKCDAILDPCNALKGMQIDLENTLNQPICYPRKVFAWICGFKCEPASDPGPTLSNCGATCTKAVKAKGVILQAEFKPECIVTHLELMEFYAWGYDVSCDEEDITIYAPGDVETCWDWCLDVDGIGCVPSYTAQTDEHTHSHSVDISADISGTLTGNTNNDTHNHTGTVTISSDGNHSHTDTGRVTSTAGNHYHSGNTYTSGAHVHGSSVSAGNHYHFFNTYFDGNHSHIVNTVTNTTGAHTHGGSTITVNNDTHSHVVNINFSGTISGATVQTDEDTHSHAFTVPAHEVDLCLVGDFDLDIDSRFVPSPCTIRIAILNKNFWEYYWYALCICTRAIWHEAEFGPAICEINDTPDCPAECEDITCEDPEYICPIPARNKFGLGDGEDVSWFGFAIDQGLLNTQTTCDEIVNSYCIANATCSTVVLPTLSHCLSYGDGDPTCSISITGLGTDEAELWADDITGLDDYCFDLLVEDGDPADKFDEDLFWRDLDSGVFDEILLEPGEAIPPGVPAFVNPYNLGENRPNED